MYKLFYSKAAQEDIKNLKKANLIKNTKKVLGVIRVDPYTNDLSSVKLVGFLRDFYSRRISYQHRIIYQVFEREKEIKIIRLRC